MGFDFTKNDASPSGSIAHEKSFEQIGSVFLGFNCSTEEKQIKEKSFLDHGDVERFVKCTTTCGMFSCFGRQFHCNLIEEPCNLNHLLQKACFAYSNKMMTTTSSNSLVDRKTTFKIERFNISNHLQVLRDLPLDSDETIQQLQKHVLSLHRHVGPISAIESDFVRQLDNTYHLIHGHLDWKWFMLTILLKLELASNDGHIILEGTKFEKMFKIIIYDLLKLAIKRFNRAPVSVLYETTPFPCLCFKEFWILLHSLLETYSISFWNELSGSLKLLGNGTNIYELHNELILKRKVKNVEIKKFNLFTVWIYSYLSQAINVNTSGFSNTCADDAFEFLEKLTNDFLANNPPEHELRVYLYNLKEIVMPWQPKIEIVMAFWNYYHKQLNSPCGLSGSTFSYTTAKGTSNSEDILNIIRNNYGQQRLNANQTSFSMFANILGCLIEDLKLIEKQTQVDKILGRIYSRLPQAKLVLLAETGLNNTATLLITLCIATRDCVVLNKVCDMIMQYPIEKVNEARQTCIAKIYVMLIMLMIENKLNVEHYLERLLGRVDDLMNTIVPHNDKPFHILKVVYDGFISIFQNEGPFVLGEHIFYGPWLVKYLNYASTAELDRLFELTNRILLQIYRNSDEDSEKLYNSIYESLYPFVKKKFSALVNSKYITILASNMCGCCRVRTKFDSMINDFLEVDGTQIETFLHFWVNIIKSENALYIKQSLVIRSWIKCCLFTMLQNEDLQVLSLYVFELDEFKEMCSNSVPNDIVENKNILHTFFHRIETTFTEMSSNADRTKLIDRFQYYFMDFEKWVPPLAPRTREFTIKLFKIISNLILFCGAIAYQRHKPANIFNTMMEKYVLPANLLMGRKIPDLTTTQSIHCAFPMLLYGISKIGYTRDAQLTMYLNNLIEKWFPYFKMVSSKTDVVVKPFIQICNKCDTPLISFLCRKLAQHFITVKESKPHSQGCLAITSIKEMFMAAKQKNEHDKILTIVESTLFDLMVHAFRTDESRPSHKSSLLFFIEISEFMKQPNCQGKIKEVYINAIGNLVKTYISYQAKPCFEFFTRIVKLNPSHGMELLDIVKKEFAELEKIRKNDTFLQNLYLNFEKNVQELCMQKAVNEL